MDDTKDTALPERARRGAAAERLATAYIMALGMDVMGRNVRVGHLELDIVARDGPAVVVVEVRARGQRAWQRPLASVGHLKRARLRRAATILWLRRWRHLPGVERVRFDAVGVQLDAGARPRLEYVRAAF